MNLKEIASDSRTKVIDVRTPAEFSGGHVSGSINIPLNEIPDKTEELKAMGGALILCCASGNRSGQAEMYLKSQGLGSVYNGGSWFDVNYLMNN